MVPDERWPAPLTNDRYIGLLRESLQKARLSDAVEGELRDLLYGELDDQERRRRITDLAQEHSDLAALWQQVLRSGGSRGDVIHGDTDPGGGLAYWECETCKRLQPGDEEAPYGSGFCRRHPAVALKRIQTP
jgi:hypothetical protein